MSESLVYNDSNSEKKVYTDDNQMLVSVDEDMNFPSRVVKRQAERLKDEDTPEGAALKTVIASALKGITPGTGEGGGPTLTPDKDYPGLYILGD